MLKESWDIKKLGYYVGLLERYLAINYIDTNLHKYQSAVYYLSKN